MDLTSQKTVKKLLNKYSARPKKGLGQCFLVSKKVFEEIIETTGLKSDNIVLEIGPGIGNLTLKLAEGAKKVIAVEKDPKMCEILKDVLESKKIKNVEIVNEDILKISNYQLSISNYKIVANLPYYLTSPVIRKFLETDNPPELMVLMIQKEVAQRIIAKPPKMSVLAVSVQFYAEPKIISYVSKKSFWPSPKVDSAIILLKIKNWKLEIDTGLFFEIVRAGFSQPRKQLLNNLSRLRQDYDGQAKKLALRRSNRLKLDKDLIISWLLENNIEPKQRAETLSITDWINLTKTFPNSLAPLESSQPKW